MTSAAAEPALKRRRTGSGGNTNKILENPPIFAGDTAGVEAAWNAIEGGSQDAVIVDANLVPEEKLDEAASEELVRYWNSRVKKTYRVPTPKHWQDLLDWNTYKTLPGLNGGMWHAYATQTHDSVIGTDVVHRLFTKITGTPEWQVHPNRLRINMHDDDRGWQSAHLEGEHVMRDTTDVGAIVCVTAGRTFTYYKGSRNDPAARALYERMGGPRSLFVKPKQAQLKQWQRTTIKTTKPGQIILFAGSVIHEISRHGKSISLFVSPFAPGEDEVESHYAECKSRSEAQLLAKRDPRSPPLPTRFRTDGTKRQHPSEFDQLSRRETEILGSLFNITGYLWPSGKLTFFLYHTMATNAHKRKLLSFCTDGQGRYDYEFITPSRVAGSAAFDSGYFDRLPLANVSDNEVARMKEKYTGIPGIAWDLVRFWTKDPRACTDIVSYRRGYIKLADLADASRPLPN